MTTDTRDHITKIISTLRQMPYRALVQSPVPTSVDTLDEILHDTAEWLAEYRAVVVRQATDLVSVTGQLNAMIEQRDAVRAFLGTTPLEGAQL
jgi:hypothetical protein